MKLTLENLISFLENKVTYNDSFSAHTVLREYEDGIGAVDFLESMSKEFNISFENFDFHQYFLDESELSRMTWKALFRRKEKRKIVEELTVQMLYQYMISNQKCPE